MKLYIQYEVFYILNTFVHMSFNIREKTLTIYEANLHTPFAYQ